jgi:hypothetical protein
MEVDDLARPVQFARFGDEHATCLHLFGLACGSLELEVGLKTGAEHQRDAPTHHTHGANSADQNGQAR